MTKIAITILVVIHLAVNVWHGNAHTELAIGLPSEKNAFVIVVILIAPLVAAALGANGRAVVLPQESREVYSGGNDGNTTCIELGTPVQRLPCRLPGFHARQTASLSAPEGRGAMADGGVYLR